jgi:multidrug efflux system membrane fusion protein
VTINQQQPVRVRFTVPVSEIPLVQRYRAAGARVIVTTPAPNSESREGPLSFVDNAVDPASGTLMLKGELANRDGLLVPGQFVDVRLVLYVEPRATVVPAPAVTTGQSGTFVYVLNADSTVTARPVTVSRTVDELAVLADGITPGETVITDGQFRLSPGARVLVRAAAGGTP